MPEILGFYSKLHKRFYYLHCRPGHHSGQLWYFTQSRDGAVPTPKGFFVKEGKRGLPRLCKGVPGVDVPQEFFNF